MERGRLVEEPPVTLGTIHSVKGGEADVVYVFPDLSQAGYQEWCLHGEGRDSVFRLFYVAMTAPARCSCSASRHRRWR